MDENVVEKNEGTELEKEIVDAVVEVAKESLNFHELYEKKEKEMKEKYADVINDLEDKEKGIDLGQAYEEMKSIAYAHLFNAPVLYHSNAEYDLVELIRDYAELLYYSHNCR